MSETHELQAQFRWTLECAGFESHRTWKIESFMEPGGGVGLRVYVHCFEETNIAESPFDVERAVLRLLNKVGEVNEEYDLRWDSQTVLPFEKLDYGSSDPIMQVVVLRGVTLSRR